MKYDVERFTNDIRTIITTYLNAKIEAINTEKNDSVVLKRIDDDAVIFQEMNQKFLNFNPFLIYGIVDIKGDSPGPFSSSIVTVSVVVVLADNGADKSPVVRLLRYQRALKEIFEAHWTETSFGAKLSIESQVPVQFDLMDSSNSHRAIGITIEGAVAS